MIMIIRQVSKSEKAFLKIYIKLLNIKSFLLLESKLLVILTIKCFLTVIGGRS